MAKKQEKEIEKWVTVNGARVPIFKDGSIGGPKALRDKVKAKVKDSGESKKLKPRPYKSSYYSEEQLKDEKFRKDALDEMKKHERDWSYYPLSERRNISPNGIKELRDRIKEIENYNKSSTKKSDDTKETQIARNKKEADERNSKKSKTWTEKDKERYEAVRAYSKGEISPEEMKNYGFSDKQLKDISEMGRREALQNVVEGKNKRTYIDPMGNLNRKKVKSKYEENYGEDYRNMSVAEARERLADDGKTNHRIINGKDVKNLDDQAILQLSVNRWKYKLTTLQDKALDDEIKSRGYVYLHGAWQKRK